MNFKFKIFVMNEYITTIPIRVNKQRISDKQINNAYTNESQYLQNKNNKGRGIEEFELQNSVNNEEEPYQLSKIGKKGANLKKIEKNQFNEYFPIYEEIKNLPVRKPKKNPKNDSLLKYEHEQEDNRNLDVEDEFRLTHGKTIDLTLLFPISKLFCLKKSMISILLSLVGFSLYFGIYGYHSLNDAIKINVVNTQYREFLFLRFHLVLVLIELVYWNKYRKKIQYYTDGFRFNVHKGLLRKHEASVSLGPATEVHLVQSKREILLNLYSVHVFTPLHHTTGYKKFSLIECLSKSNAQHIKQFLVKELDRQVSAPK